MRERYRNGLAVIDASPGVFRARPGLAVLPLSSLATVGTAYAAVGLAFLRYGLLEAVLENEFVKYGALFAALAVSSGVGVFFNAAVVHCATRQFDGEETSVRSRNSIRTDLRRYLTRSDRPIAVTRSHRSPVDPILARGGSGRGRRTGTTR